MGQTTTTSRDLVPGFAALVRRGREALRWSRAKLAEEAGLSANTVSAIEREVRAPSLRVASALVGAMSMVVMLHDPAVPIFMLTAADEKKSAD